MVSRNSSLSAALHEGRPLADAIMDATRSVHTKLNKLIVARLPLALPPRAEDPAIYVSGLLHITPIYATFEALWRNILDASPSSPTQSAIVGKKNPWLHYDNGGPILSPPIQPEVSDRLRTVLDGLHLDGLLRSDRLKADIAALTGWPDHVVEEQLREISEAPPLADFIAHIKTAVLSRPHVLLAYSYILYMALFSGGRFIRASLESAGQQFWERPLSPVRPTLRDCFENHSTSKEPASLLDMATIASAAHRSHANHMLPLRFFHFATPFDGEDLKREFKQRLAVLEKQLSSSEMNDVVSEAHSIFDHMILLVQQLDLACEDVSTPSEAGLSIQGLTQLLKNPLASRFRDSVAVTKERNARGHRVPSKASSNDSSDESVVRHSMDKTSKKSRSSFESDTALANHPALPVVTGIELAQGLGYKAVRFQPSLPSSQLLAAALPRATGRRIHQVGVLNRALMVLLSVVFLGLLFRSRQAANAVVV